jgi:ubiquinone/menaquinone biosynthesis C-methylase UbiE
MLRREDLESSSTAVFYMGIENKESKVIDVGCGSMSWVTENEFVGYAVGVEPRKEAAEVASQNNPRGDVVIARGESLPFRDGCFDQAASIETLDYTQDPTRVLNEIYRVVRPLSRKLRQGLRRIVISIKTKEYLLRMKGSELKNRFERILSALEQLERVARKVSKKVYYGRDLFDLDVQHHYVGLLNLPIITLLIYFL